MCPRSTTSSLSSREGPPDARQSRTYTQIGRDGHEAAGRAVRVYCRATVAPAGSSRSGWWREPQRLKHAADREPPRAASRRGRRRSACVVNGRLRQAGEGAVRRACSARRNGTPGGILPLRVCTVLPRGDPVVAVYGPATATCMPPPALSGSGVSPSIRPLLLLPATRQPVVCRTGFPTADRIQASVAMPRRVSNGGFAFHVRPWKLLVVAARFWRMSSTLGCQSRR